MTQIENNQLSEGFAIKYTKGTTDTLFEYSNQIFKNDFTSLIPLGDQN